MSRTTPAQPPLDNTPHARLTREQLKRDSLVRGAIDTLAAVGPAWCQGVEWRRANLAFSSDYFAGTALDGWTPPDLGPLERFLAMAGAAVGPMAATPGAPSPAPKEPVGGGLARGAKSRLNEEAAGLAAELLERRGAPERADRIAEGMRAGGWPGFPYLSGGESDEKTLYRVLQSRPARFKLREGGRWALASWGDPAGEAPMT